MALPKEPLHPFRAYTGLSLMVILDLTWMCISLMLGSKKAMGSILRSPDVARRLAWSVFWCASLNEDVEDQTTIPTGGEFWLYKRESEDALVAKAVEMIAT